MRPLLLIVILLLNTFTPEARADDSAMKLPADPNALTHLTQGNRLYGLRKFEEAIAEYQAGAMIELAPVFDYNLGQCYRQLGRYTEAIWHYERFLNYGRPSEERQTLVTDFLRQMRAELDRKAMTQPPVEPAPPPTPESATSGQALPANLQPVERSRGMPLQRKLAIGVGVANVAVVGLGVGIGLRAQSLKDDAAEICPTNPCARSDEANKLIDRGKSNALYANVAFGVGGAAILGAAVLWITGAQVERKTTAIVPQVSRTFAGVAASVRF